MNELEITYDEFLQYMTSERNASELTIISYQRDFVTFQKFLSIMNIEPELCKITTMDIRRYINYLKLEKEFANETIRRKIHSLASYFKFLLEVEYIEKNPMLPIRAPKEEETLPIFINESDLKKLLEAPNLYARFPEHRKRDTVLIALLVYSGARKMEVISLNWNSVNFAEQSITIRKGKGKKDRVIPLLEPLALALIDYYNERQPSANEPILLSDNNTRISPSNFGALFRRYVKKAGLDGKGYTPHKCRHTFASLLFQNGVDILTIQQLLGHSDLNTTKVYTHTTTDFLRAEVAKFPTIITS
jgi:site-specific recombinase XerD